LNFSKTSLFVFIGIVFVGGLWWWCYVGVL